MSSSSQLPADRNSSGFRSQVSGLVSRRQALKALAAGAALPFLGGRAEENPLIALTEGAIMKNMPRPPISGIPLEVMLGVATVSLKALPLDAMLAAVKRMGLDQISLHRAHSPWENQPGQWTEIAAKIRAADVTPLCCGVLNLKNDEPAMRRMMEYVKAHGLNFFSCSPEPAALPLLEKLVQEYEFLCAIHNHGPEDRYWPSVVGVMAAIESLDPRIGLCLDVGHCYRSDESPVAMIQQHRRRLYDVHLKDTLADPGDRKDTPVEMGRGNLDLKAILGALTAAGYPYNVWLEYEKDPNDPVPGLAESVGYVRGLARGMSVMCG
jgi:inosose dehydratase